MIGTVIDEGEVIYVHHDVRIELSVYDGIGGGHLIRGDKLAALILDHPVIDGNTRIGGDGSEEVDGRALGKKSVAYGLATDHVSDLSHVGNLNVQVNRARDTVEVYKTENVNRYVLILIGDSLEERGNRLVIHLLGDGEVTLEAEVSVSALGALVKLHYCIGLILIGKLIVKSLCVIRSLGVKLIEAILKGLSLLYDLLVSEILISCEIYVRLKKVDYSVDVDLTVILNLVDNALEVNVLKESDDLIEGEVTEEGIIVIYVVVKLREDLLLKAIGYPAAVYRLEHRIREQLGNGDVNGKLTRLSVKGEVKMLRDNSRGGIKSLEVRIGTVIAILGHLNREIEGNAALNSENLGIHADTVGEIHILTRHLGEVADGGKVLEKGLE